MYAHLGTGNYHPGNARIYTDLSFFTCDPDITHDAAMVFNYLTSNTLTPTRVLAVAPDNLRSRLFDLIDREIHNARAGRPAHVWAKLNSLIDPRMIDKLYEASEAGVEVDLVVRSHCTLRPGIEGLSSNIRVKSIIGRFLEHSRIYCFANGYTMPDARAEVFMSSADWMDRNFDDRAELRRRAGRNAGVKRPLEHHGGAISSRLRTPRRPLRRVPSSDRSGVWSDP